MELYLFKPYAVLKGCISYRFKRLGKCNRRERDVVLERHIAKSRYRIGNRNARERGAIIKGVVRDSLKPLVERYGLK